MNDDNFENGALLGKSELSSTAITCEPAPIPKRISVALGDNEIIRVGFESIACALGADERVAKLSNSAEASANFLVFIKNSPKG